MSSAKRTVDRFTDEGDHREETRALTSISRGLGSWTVAAIDTADSLNAESSEDDEIPPATRRAAPVRSGSLKFVLAALQLLS